MIELYNGDCVEVLKRIDKTNAIIVTDPPFLVEYQPSQECFQKGQFAPLRYAIGSYEKHHRHTSRWHNRY